MPSLHRRWLALAVVLAGAFVVYLDIFIVNVAIPSLRHDLGAGEAQAQWVLAAYQLAYAVALVSGGRVGDAIGRRRAFLLGIGGFTLASALCGAAPSAEALIAARALQGLAAALLFPQVLSIIQVTFPPAERPRAFAVMGAVIGVATIAGQLVGGSLIALDPAGLGWRAVFLVNLPLGVGAIVAARRLVPESRAPEARRLDLGGVALASAALLLLLLALVEGREAGWPAWVWLALAAVPPLGAAFAVWERRVAAAGGAPLFALSLLEIISLRRGLGLVLVFYLGLNAFFLMLAFYLQDGMGRTPLQSGLIYTPLALGFFVVSLLAPRLVRRLGPAALALGAAVAAGGYVAVVALVAAAGATLPTAPLIVALVAIGCGQALFLTPLFATVLQGVPTARRRRRVGRAEHRPAGRRRGRRGGDRRALLRPARKRAGPRRLRQRLRDRRRRQRRDRAGGGAAGAAAAARGRGGALRACRRRLRRGVRGAAGPTARQRFSVTFALTPAPATVSVTCFARRRLLRAAVVKRRVTVALPPLPAFALPEATTRLPLRAVSFSFAPALTPPTRTTSPRVSALPSFAAPAFSVACGRWTGLGAPLLVSSPGLGAPRRARPSRSWR